MTDISTNEARLAITASALAGDAGAVYRIVADVLDQGMSFETALFDLLMHSESQAGTRWQQGDYLVTEEHATTAVIETVISLLAGSLSRPVDGDLIVVATAEGDLHSLPARAVAAHLLYLGHPTTFLGADVPAADLTEFLETGTPSALVIASAMVQHMFGVREAIKGSHSLGVPVIVGGRGFGESGEWARILGADSWVSEPRQVAEVLGTWAPDINASEDAAIDPSPALEDLARQRLQITSQALSRLNGSDPRLQSEMELLVGALLASELVDNMIPLEDTLGWQATTLAAHGYDPAPDLAGPLADVIAATHPSIHQRLLAATR